MTAPDNPYFARAMANWVWAQLFSKGLVDPPDDMSRANPPVHPELLDALAQHFVAAKFDLRDLIRTIAMFRNLRPVVGHGGGQRARHAPVLSPSAAAADGAPDGRRPGPGDRRRQSFSGRRRDPPGDRGARPVVGQLDPRHVRPLLPDGRLRVDAQRRRSSLRQALLLIGGDVIESKVTSLNGYLASALKLELEPEELVENLYYRTVCRPPTAEELSHWAAELKQASSQREAAEDLFWALLELSGVCLQPLGLHGPGEGLPGPRLDFRERG